MMDNKPLLTKPKKKKTLIPKLDVVMPNLPKNYKPKTSIEAEDPPLEPLYPVNPATKAGQLGLAGILAALGFE
jgi:hypothetical protein